MLYDAHIHMILDGVYWKDAFARHQTAVDERWIHSQLAQYAAAGYTYLRDGGDRWGVSLRAKQLAGAYGIRYRSPAFPICKAGHYGTFIGKSFETIAEYQSLVQLAKSQGADFIKIMISGLMDYDRYGSITSTPLSREEIAAMISVAHDAGLAVMAHANGSDTVRLAAEAGVDSVEHGAYLQKDALQAMAAHSCIWVPTVTTVISILGCGRYSDHVLSALIIDFKKNILKAASLGVPIAIGSDAGAYLVPHRQGAEAERRYLHSFIGSDSLSLKKGEQLLLQKF